MSNSDLTIKSLATALNFRQLRQEIIASNIANAETPGYKAKRVDFEDALSSALDLEEAQRLNVMHNKHVKVGGGGFDNLSPEIYEDPNGVVSDDGNTVDRDDEMAKMAQNKIMYDATVQLLNKKMGLLKYVIQSER